MNIETESLLSLSVANLPALNEVDRIMIYVKNEIAIAKNKIYLDFVRTFVVRRMPWTLGMGHHLA